MPARVLASAPDSRAVRRCAVASAVERVRSPASWRTWRGRDARATWGDRGTACDRPRRSRWPAGDPWNPGRSTRPSRRVGSPSCVRARGPPGHRSGGRRDRHTRTPGRAALGEGPGPRNPSDAGDDRVLVPLWWTCPASWPTRGQVKQTGWNTAGMAPAPYTSALAESLAPDLLDRFQRYVRVDTQSRPQRTGSPSTPGQLDLGRMLVSELHDAGIADAFLDDNGYVVASLDPVGAEPGGPTIGLIAHMDKSPAAPGKGVEPLVHREWDGGVIELPREGTRLDPAAIPEMNAKLGHDLVTGSGDTLLGADDKAGVAAIMAAVARLAADPQLPRPRLRIAFTPDEEIGLGASLFDIERFGALCAYTIDGSEVGELQDETFSAAEVTLTVHGVDVHPGLATGKLVSALRLAAKIWPALPADTLAPETTAGREGFIHPYVIDGTPGEARVTAI